MSLLTRHILSRQGLRPGNGGFTLRGEADMESLGQEVDPFALTHPASRGQDAMVQD